MAEGWGERRPPLRRDARRFLEQTFGGALGGPPLPLVAGTPGPSALPATARARLAAVVGEPELREDAESRLRHAGGQSFTDLMARRTGAAGVPDAVVLPGTPGEVAAVLEICADESVAVVPFGGGTSVVGGVTPAPNGFPAVVTLDVSRLDQLLAVDRESLTATVQAGIRAPALDAVLAEHGLVLGHLPQSYERASLGGFVATRSAGQSSTGRGRIDDLLLGLRLATPVGELVLPAQPGSAAGPDLRRVVLGSEGALGVVTEATVRVRPRPAVSRYEGWALPSWSAGLTAVRRIAQQGFPPDVVRLSDEAETRLAASLGGAGRLPRAALRGYLAVRRRADGCLLILGCEGSRSDVRWRNRRAARPVRAAGGVRLGRAVGAAWARDRFTAPYLRDTLLDHGLLVETVETATTWSRLPAIYDGARGALRDSLGTPRGSPLVGCHVSHLYSAGASLYFTVLARRDGDGLAQWEGAKVAVSEAIVAAGGTISHHHGVGTAHLRWLGEETGPLGLALLRAVKATLDPTGVLNPGKLLPPR